MKKYFKGLNPKFANKFKHSFALFFAFYFVD